MNYKIYVDKQDINDATSFYIDIIRDSILASGSSVVKVHKLNDIENDDIVVVVKVTSAFRVKRHNKKQRVMIWLQGIQPEEIAMSSIPCFAKIYYYLAYRYLEYFTFKHVDFFIYVSQEMLKHYQRKFGSIAERYFLMPCFNLQLDEQAFRFENKYTIPSFVYAGSLDAWQCFPETIEAFKAIQSLVPNATLTILTREITKAKEIAEEHGLADIEVKYVPKDAVQNELKKYKYGFILRKNISVNRVATPTKINSYMASGVIPIVSECLTDFIANTKNSHYIIRATNGWSVTELAQQIAEFEHHQLIPAEVLNDFKSVFENYYNRMSYLNGLAEKIKQYENSISL